MIYTQQQIHDAIVKAKHERSYSRIRLLQEIIESLCKENAALHAALEKQS